MDRLKNISTQLLDYWGDNMLEISLQKSHLCHKGFFSGISGGIKTRETDQPHLTWKWPVITMVGYSVSYSRDYRVAQQNVSCIIKLKTVISVYLQHKKRKQRLNMGDFQTAKTHGDILEDASPQSRHLWPQYSFSIESTLRHTQ